MYIEKRHVPIVVINVLVVIGFALHFMLRQNFEFIIYVGVILFFMWAVLASNKKVQYTTGVFVGLTVWAFLHMAGGGVFINGVRLYDVMLLPLSDVYPVIRYDQCVHALGFGVATYVFYRVLLPHLKTGQIGPGVSIIIVLTGLGAGCINEIIEFFVSQLFDAGVGGYINTSLDLISNLIGSLLALVIIQLNNKKGLVERSKEE